jgi:RNA polymerase sigma-70 factor (ECF subfamily)
MAIATVPVVNGDILTQEFESIFRENCLFVYRTAYSVTGNHSDAEDVVQTVFLKLLQRNVPLHLKKEPKAYLYRAAVNSALNIVRSRKRQKLTGEAEGLTTPAPEPGDEGALETIRQNLMDAIAQLNPSVVEILILRYAHDYTDAQIAQMLRKSRGTIAVTLYRARVRLKKLMRSGEDL